VDRPASLIVLGGNAVGLELAQAYARFGTQVTVLEILPRITPGEEPEIGEALAGYLRDEGLQVETDGHVTRVEREAAGYRLTAERGGERLTFAAEQLLVATGRRANTAGLGLKEAGVEVGKHGSVQVNEYLQTANPDVYAAGDVLGEDMYV